MASEEAKISGTLTGDGRNSSERHMVDHEPMPDRDLLQRFSEGDREAFTALYREHFPAVFRFVLYMTGDRIEAGEVTQDVFVWLIHHSGDFDPGRGQLPAFLGGVARKMLHRRQQLGRRWLPLDEGALRPSADAALDLVDGIGKRRDLEQLRRAIATLPERYREALVACDLEEKSYQEAAEELGCALGTVRSRLHRARELLVRKLQWKKEGQKC